MPWRHVSWPFADFGKLFEHDPPPGRTPTLRGQVPAFAVAAFLLFMICFHNPLCPHRSRKKRERMKKQHTHNQKKKELKVGEGKSARKKTHECTPPRLGGFTHDESRYSRKHVHSQALRGVTPEAPPTRPWMQDPQHQSATTKRSGRKGRGAARCVAADYTEHATGKLIAAFAYARMPSSYVWIRKTHPHNLQKAAPSPQRARAPTR